MGDYTRVGVTLWSWRPYLEASPLARAIWLALFTGPRAKGWPPGLYMGGPAVVAEEAHIPFPDAITGLAELAERKLIEQDPVHRLIRMTELPDRGERAANGKGILRWWCGFKLLPACACRDRHIPLLEWLLTPLTDNHLDTWKETFGDVQVPGRDVEYDTRRTVTLVSNQLELADSNNIGNRYPNGWGITAEAVSGSGKRKISGEGSGERALPLPAPPEPAVPPPEPAREAFLAEGTQPGTRPPLGLCGAVAAAPPTYTGADMLAAIARQAGGRFPDATLLDQRLEPALDLVARQAADKGVTEADLELLGSFFRAGGLSWRQDLGPVWAARPGNLLDAVANARGWQKGEVQIPDPTGRAKPPTRLEPSPQDAFTPGRRAL